MSLYMLYDTARYYIIRTYFLHSSPWKTLAGQRHMTYVMSMELPDVTCIRCRNNVMSLPHAILCLDLSYIPVEVKDENDVLLCRGYTEGYDGTSIYVLDLETQESNAYPSEWVMPIVS